MDKTEQESSEPIVIIEDKKGIYEEPWVKEYIILERNKGKTYQDIADGLRDRGIDKASPAMVMTSWKRFAATAQVSSTEAKDDWISFTEDLKALYGDSIKLMGEYVRRLRHIIELIDGLEEKNEEGKSNKLELQIAISKQIPLATGIMREIREYVKNQIGLYDTISRTAEKDVVYSPQQMMEWFNQFMPEYLRAQEKEGKIKILDKTILK